MQTTLRINDEIYRRAKRKAGDLGLSLTRFLEEALEERLTNLEQRPAKRVTLPVSSVSGKPMTTEEFKQRLASAGLEDDLNSLR